MDDGWPVWWTITPLRLLLVLALVYVGGQVMIRVVRMVRQPPDSPAKPAGRTRVTSSPGRVPIVPGRESTD